MNISRREFLQMLAVASASGLSLEALGSDKTAVGAKAGGLYDLPRFGNVSLLHYTDCHAQMLPIYFREPSGVLFELATPEPGFGVDEDPEHLGEKLILPPFLEDRREEIEKVLTPITNPRQKAAA